MYHRANVRLSHQYAGARNVRCGLMTSNLPLCDLPNGYWRVPGGKLANATVWMQMRHRPAAGAEPALMLKRVPALNTPEIRSVFNRIGASSLWDRTAQLNQDRDSSPWSPGDLLYFAYDAGRHVGLIELAHSTDSAGGTEIEISYFGLFPEFIGSGMGKRLLVATLDAAWEFEPTRLYLHTCNTDHPSAFAFYRAGGFTPYAVGFQIMDDPRSHGWLPKDSAPHVPFIDI
jgi:GNAT superfamily N-acetyltransferase